MKILVRLPNWLGDMVMSTGFVHQLNHFFPGAEISVIAKRGIHELLSLFPPFKHSFIFSKQEYKGLTGLIGFGKLIRRTEKFELFFSLPDSLSAAVLGAAGGAQVRIGYRNELRQLLLTHAYTKPEGLHRVEEYVQLLTGYTGKERQSIDVSLHHSFGKNEHVVMNINSEASSRRLTMAKAIELVSQLRTNIGNPIILIGASKEVPFVDSVLSGLPDRRGVESRAGKTSLMQLTEILASAQVLLSTDSGPAHLANALGTHTIVLFGAGRESNTAPYNKDLRNIVRLGQLSCEPCQKNVCVRYEIPQCLERLDSSRIVELAKMKLT